MTFRLADAARFVLPPDAGELIARFLQTRAEDGFEGLVLLGGKCQEGGTLTLSTVIFPRQIATQSFGLSVRLQRGEEAELTRILGETQRALFAKVHGHPDASGHGPLDDENMLLKTTGGFSIVVPYFCRHGFEIAACAIYRCDGLAWRRLDPLEIERTFVPGATEVEVIDRFDS